MGGGVREGGGRGGGVRGGDVGGDSNDRRDQEPEEKEPVAAAAGLFATPPYSKLPLGPYEIRILILDRGVCRTPSTLP